jgi:hypothetical protein
MKQGSSLSGFQSPYTSPNQAQRASPAPTFSAVAPREKSSQQVIPSTQKRSSSTPTNKDGATRGPETPKIGGKWAHPALRGIERETRKFMFGEEELKKLIVNAVLLYSVHWASVKIEEK